MDQNNTYYFGTGISYDPNNDEYTLTGTVEKVWRNYLNDSKGMYTCKQSTAAPCSTVYYISGGDSYDLYGLELTGGNLLTDVDREIKFSSSYSESNGVYTLDNPETVTLSNWVSNYTKYSKYFTCGDNNTSCNNLQYVSSIGKTSYSYYEVNNNFIYSNSFTYDGTKYILDTNNSIQAYDLSDTNVVNSLKNKKYTCYNTTGECQQLYYKVSSYSIILENGESITDALNTMLKADDVNQKSSTIKMALDAWYKKYMLAYSNMLEDTVFCNNRNISDLGNFDPNKTYGNLTFSEFDLSTDLSCSNITDRFSTNNTKAQLTYPVGIISAPEAKLFGDSNSLKEGSNYRTLTPYQYVINNNDYVTTYFINTYGGNFSESNVTNTYGVRPVISLKPNTKYTTGDGSFATPYVVDMST